jgi:hypothetical protein
MPTERPQLVGKVSATFADRGYHVVSLTDPYGHILGFLDRKNSSHCYKKMLWHIQFQTPVKNGIYFTKFSPYVALSFHVWSSGQSF